MKSIILGITLALASLGAYASGNSNNSGNVDVNIGDVKATVGNVSATGGAGGSATATGGAGGSATIQSGAVRNEIDNRNTNVNTNVNTNSNKQGQVQGQKQGQVQGQSQSAVSKQSQSADNKGNSQTINFDEKRQAPGVAAPAMNSTASCRVGVSGGVSFPGGAVALGSAYKDESCDKREKGRLLIESARLAQQMGATAEFYGDLFMEGLALIRESDAAEKSAVRPTAAPTSIDAGMNP